MFHFLPHWAALRTVGGAAALLLTCSLASCEKQQATPIVAGQAANTPATQSPFDYYYFNGQPSTEGAIANLSPKVIARVDVLRGQQAIDYTHDANAKSAVLVQTW